MGIEWEWRSDSMHWFVDPAEHVSLYVFTNPEYPIAWAFHLCGLRQEFAEIDDPSRPPLPAAKLAAESAWRRWARETAEAAGFTVTDPARPALKLWYMRDNHTFRSLPLDIEGAVTTMREEWDAGHTGGCLFAKPAAPNENPMRDSSGVTGSAHAGWGDFETRARDFLARALPPLPVAEVKG